MTLPKQYEWLTKEPAPKMLLEALKLYGTIEVPGEKDSPIILGWAKELGLTKTYSHDSVAWCGLFVAIVALRAEYGDQIPKNPLWALNWKFFGQDGGQPELGDVLTFIREGGGHAGFYVGEDDPRIVTGRPCYHVLGGNQSDAVSIKRVEKVRLRSVRQPIWKVGKPPNVRSIALSPKGEITDNEA